MAGIFVSYRRKDSAGHAGRLYDRLRDHFGASRVFRDVDYLKPGEDFVEAIARAVDGCDVFIAVIGRDWHDARNERGERRLDDPDDFIRLELETALRRGVLVLPVLVEGATMVQAPDLPEPLRPLARRQAIELSEQRWDFDVLQLIRRIDDVLRPTRPFWKRRGAAAAAAGALLLAAAGFLILPGLLDPDDGGPSVSADPDSTGVLVAAESAAAPVHLPDTARDPGTTTEPPATSPSSSPAAPAQPPPAADPDARGGAPDAATRTVPELRQRSPRDAMNALNALGLVPVPLWTRQAGAPTPVVRSQLPRNGTIVRPGEGVRYTYVLPLSESEVAGGRTFLVPGRGLDLDPESAGAAGFDLLFDRTDGAGAFLYAGKGAEAGVVTLDRTRPSPATCAAAKWGLSRLLLERDAGDLALCIRTGRGRTAFVQIDSLIARPPEVLIRYTTW